MQHLGVIRARIIYSQIDRARHGVGVVDADVRNVARNVVLRGCLADGDSGRAVGLGELGGASIIREVRFGLRRYVVETDRDVRLIRRDRTAKADFELLRR